MRAIVLAGGHATRLWPITKNRAKPLLPVNGRPIIDFIIEELEEREDMEKIYISTNAKFAEDFEDYVNEFGYCNVEVIVEDQMCEEEKPGTIGAIIQLLDKKPSDDYLIIGGDNYQTLDIKQFLDEVEGFPGLACYKLESKEKAKSFGVVETNGDYEIIGFQEKPDKPKSTLASTACYFFPEKHLELFDKYEEHFSQTDVPAEQYLDEPGRLIEWGHKQTTFKGVPFEGAWVDVGTREGYLEAFEAIYGEDMQIVEGEVDNCELSGNVYVMEGAKVSDSELEDTIVFPDALITNSHLKGSIVDKKAILNGAEADDSLIGEHSKVKQ